MKIKILVLSSLIGIIVLSMGHEYSLGESKEVKPSGGIGVVCIERIFQECKRNAAYRQEATAEQDSIVAELEKLSKEVEAEKAGIKTLKVGSNDYMLSMKEILEKQAKLQAQEEFQKQQLGLKDQRWTEELYNDILQRTSEVAQQKGLDMVLEKGQMNLPAGSVNELMLRIRTHKVLYSGGCVDITDEVMAKVDESKEVTPN